MNENLSMHVIYIYIYKYINIYIYILEALRHLMLNARTSAWINQKGYTTYPYINHYVYPKSTRHYAEYQDFSLGEPERIHSISLY